ncbi:hypothetical protein ACHAXR_013377 [Thalassiosira sp. AJA248-18]
MQLSSCLPCMEESGHELCFISHPNYDRRLSCNIFGHIWMDSNWKGWEVWRFINVDNSGTFIITSWTHDHKVLCSDGGGGVFTTENKEGSWEKWRISLHPKSHGVRIESVEHRRFLAFSGHDLYTMDKEEDTAWNLEPAHGNHFFISATCHDKRLSSSIDHTFTHHNREAWEKWVLEPDNGLFALRSLKHGKYLCSEDGNLTVSGSGDSWAIISSPHGGFFIQLDGCKLSCDGNGHLCTTEDRAGCWETWRLEPIMPGTISGKQIWSLVGAGLSVIGLTAVAPMAVMRVVKGGKGIWAERVAQGSMAVGMIAAEAIAEGGGVVAFHDDQERVKIETSRERLPLCSWRMWQ